MGGGNVVNVVSDVNVVNGFRDAYYTPVGFIGKLINQHG
jgi:hypothetical protein